MRFVYVIRERSRSSTPKASCFWMVQTAQPTYPPSIDEIPKAAGCRSPSARGLDRTGHFALKIVHRAMKSKSTVTWTRFPVPSRDMRKKALDFPEPESTPTDSPLG